MELRQFTCISIGAAFGVVRPYDTYFRFIRSYINNEK